MSPVFGDDTYTIVSSEVIDPYHYRTYNETTDFLINLQQSNTDIMKVTSIGQTYQGRDIWMVKLSDNVMLDEDEPGVLFMGAHHGNEKVTYEVLLNFIEYITETYKRENTDDDSDGTINEDPIDGIDNDNDGSIDEDPSEDRVRTVLNNTQIYIIPMVSPDGVEANSRKNMAPNYGPFDTASQVTSIGVNLNRNYDDNWYLYYMFPLKYHFLLNTLDSSFNYRGPYPFSENETKAVKDFVDEHDILISLSFHSYSEVILFPWMHTSAPTPDEDLFISIGENMSSINKYRLYTGGDYLIPRLGGTLGSSENWLYREHGIISFTMELCRTYAPEDSQEVLEASYSHIGVNLYVSERSWTIER